MNKNKGQKFGQKRGGGGHYGHEGKRGWRIEFNIWQNWTFSLCFYTFKTLCFGLYVSTILDLMFLKGDIGLTN